MPSVAVTLRGVSRSILSGYALRHIDLDFTAGEKVLVLGHNGAGKSTLLKVMSGLSRPDKGAIGWSFDSRSVVQKELWTKLGFFSQNLQIYSQLSVRDNIRLFFGLRGISERIEEELNRWNLSAHARKPVCELSKGLQARVALAITFVHEPSMVLLDEPTSSLDEEGANVLLSALESTREKNNALSIVASHDIVRFAPVCDRIVVLEQARVALDTKNLSTDLTIEEAKEVVIGRYRGSNR